MHRDTFLFLGFLRFLGFRANRQFYDIRNYRLSCPSVKIIFYRVDMSIIVVQIEELGISQSHSLMPAYPQ